MILFKWSDHKWHFIPTELTKKVVMKKMWTVMRWTQHSTENVPAQCKTNKQTNSKKTSTENTMFSCTALQMSTEGTVYTAMIHYCTYHLLHTINNDWTKKLRLQNKSSVLFDCLEKIVAIGWNIRTKREKKDTARYQAIVMGSWKLTGCTCHMKATTEKMSR